MSKYADWLDRKVNKRLAHFTGFKFVKAQPTLDQARNFLIREFGVSVVIDGGANQGQWASKFRKDNPGMKIFSFEPVVEPFNILSALSKFDDNWEIFNCALGEQEEDLEINLASNEFMSSSIRNPSKHLDDFPNVHFSNKRKIEVKRLDTFNFGSDSDLVLLKLDVQGYEMQALTGSEKIFPRIALIEIETAFYPMYEGELRHSEIISWLEKRGFEVYSIGQPSINSNGRVGYLDCLLVNAALLPS